MAENIIRVVFEDNATNAAGSANSGSNNAGSMPGNNSPLNINLTQSETILNNFTAKIQHAVELVKSLTAQTRLNYTSLKAAAAKIDPIFDPKSVKEFNQTLKEATQDNTAIIKQFKEVNKSLSEFNKQLKNTENNKNNDKDNHNNKIDNSGNNVNFSNNGGNGNNNPNNFIAALAKTMAGGLPLYYATEAFRSYAVANALDYGNNLLNPLAYASQRRELEFGQNRSIASGIGALLGGVVGSVIPGIGTALGVGLGAAAGSQIANLGYTYFGGQDKAQDQLQYEVSQNYTNLSRGNVLSQQLAGMYSQAFNKSTATKNMPDMFLLPQFLQMGSMNQYGGNLSVSDLAGAAKIANRYNANPSQVGSLLAQINASVKNMQAALLNVDAHAQKTGGDIVSQLAAAVQLIQKGGLAAPDAINKAFNQSLYGTTYASAQNGYLQSPYINQFRLRMLGKIAGIDVEGLMQGDSQAIAKFNKLQAKAANNRLNPDAKTILVNTVAQNLGLGNGQIEANSPNSGAVNPYPAMFNKLSNPEAVQQKNYKSLGLKNPDQDLSGIPKEHDSFKAQVISKATRLGSKVMDKGQEYVDDGKEYVNEGLTTGLAREYLTNLRQMETDKKTGNMADYNKLDQLNKNLEQQIKAINKNTQALHQKHMASGAY